MSADSTAPTKQPVVIFGSIWILIILSRFLGPTLFDNDWGLSTWRHLPLWEVIAVIALPLVVGAILWQAETSRWNHNRTKVAAGVLAGLSLAIVVDSFVYAGGNLRVAALAQAPTIVWRWYEWGAMAVAEALYHLWSLLGLTDNQAGVYAWRTVSWGMALLGLWGAWLICQRLTSVAARRLSLFVLIWFAPQLLVLLGYVGLEGTVAVSTIWIAHALMRLDEKRTPSRFAALWGILILGSVMYIGALYLLPAVLAATVAGGKRSGRSRQWTMGGVGLVVILATVYYAASAWFGFTRQVLFLDGKAPFGDYGLFSGRHLGDVLQLLWILIPAMLAVKLVLLKRWPALLRDRVMTGLVIMSLSGGLVVFVTDPFYSIVLDLPRLAVFLSPLPILGAVALVRANQLSELPRGLFSIAAALAVAAMLAILPTYACIAGVDPVARGYFDKHDWFHRDGALAFRDAYFYRGEMDPANAWEQGRLTKSPDFLDIVGINDLVHSNRIPEAISRLYAIKTRNRYWIEPRSILAGLLMQTGRFEEARPEIDTMLMLDPWRRESLMNRYIYYRDRGEPTRAMQYVDRALATLPGDIEILRDKMLLYHHMGAHDSADSMALKLIEIDPDLPQPYLLRGLYEDARGNQVGATNFYRRFLKLAPDSPEAARISERLDRLAHPDSSQADS